MADCAPGAYVLVSGVGEQTETYAHTSDSMRCCGPGPLSGCYSGGLGAVALRGSDI